VADWVCANCGVGVLCLSMEAYTFTTDLQYKGHRPTTLTISPDGQITGELGDAPVDVGSWKSPPHVALANMSIPQMVEGFSRRYGILGDVKPRYAEQYKKLSDGEDETTPSELLNLDVATFLVEQTFVTATEVFTEAQSLLRLAWLGDKGTLRIVKQAVRRADYQVIPPGEVRNEQTILSTRDLWQYLCFLFVLDYWDGKTGRCANPECAVTPYFIQQRKDQEYCNHACAVIGTNARRAAQKRGEADRPNQTGKGKK
jgi:hypothetical protein